MEALAGRRMVGQRQHGHLRTKVGATDADVDDVGDAGIGPHLLGKGQHAAAFGLRGAPGGCYVFRSIISSNDAGRCTLSQQKVHGRALLGAVDGSAGKQRVAVLLQPAFARQRKQQLLGRGVDAVLGQVAHHMGGLLAEMGEAAGIGGKRGAQIHRAAAGGVIRLQLRPGSGLVTTGPRHGQVHHAQAASIRRSS